MRIIRYLKESKAALAVVVVLLMAQAFADLSLPRYTSDLVDVGIQQQGIEHVSPEEMRDETFGNVCMLASCEDEEFIASCYDRDGATWRLNEQGVRCRDELDGRMALPLALFHYASASPNAASEAPFDMAALRAAYDAGSVSKSEVVAAVDVLRAAFPAVDDALVEQQAVAAARAEYEGLGYDMGALQMDYLARVGARMLGVAALMACAAVGVGYMASRTAAKTARRLRERLFEKVLSFSDADVRRFSAASLITRGTNDIQQVQMVIVVLLRVVLYAPILAIGGIYMVSRTNASMGWVIALAVAAVFAIVGVLFVVAMPKFKAMQALIDRVNSVVREILTGLPVIRAFGRRKHEEGRFDEASRALMRTQLFTNRAMTFMMPSMMLVMNAVSVLIVWVGGHAIDAAAMQTGDMIAFITYSMVVIMSFLMIGMVSVMLPRADVAARRIDEVLEAPCSVSDPEHPVPPARVCAPGVCVEFDDVTFAYDAQGAPALDHVSFTAEAGETTALIGPTGSGKSTVVKLIERFYDVSSGAVRVDGVDVRALRQRDLRAMFGYVPQKAFLFSGTVAEVVAYGNPSMDEAQLRLAARVAQADAFVSRREGGYEASVLQGGTNVSGGQRQRLAIARAVALDARGYLFDDSFSALDYETDAAVRAALADNLAGKTKIIVAQRISTVLHADKIVVFDDGRVVGQGTHDALMRDCPTYREIAFSQLSEDELKGVDRR
ncbi:MAG: ABC transporter ATP-binding protein [Slackia sp.]|nr:ABC transporter ATP-binding protein [Slackia sp.]